MRIAILNASSYEELEPLLVSTLSKAEGIALLERTDVERVIQEHALSKSGNLAEQLSIASLLNADGLLMLGKETVDKSEILTVRLTAVEPGVVIGSALFALRKGESESLAQDVASRFLPLLRKLKVKREQALPVSLLNLRCPVKSAVGEKLEKQLTFLFSNQLIASPELFVLERWRLADAAFEKAFAGMGEGGFWNGSYLVDGEIQISGTNPFLLKVKIFARSPNNSDLKSIEATGDSDNLPNLATDLANRLAALFAKKPAPFGWSPIEESREYLREAEWAYRGGLFQTARSAIEASSALGNRDPKCFQLGAKIYSDLAYHVNSHIGLVRGDTNNVDVSKDPERIHCAQLALDSLKRLIACPESLNAKNLPMWEAIKCRKGYIGNTVLLASSLVLRNGHEHGMLGDSSLAEMRANIRELLPYLESCKPDYPDLVAAVFYPFWYENPVDQLAACRLLLQRQPPEDRWQPLVKIRSILMRMDTSLENGSANFGKEKEILRKPRVVCWNGQAVDAAALWQSLVRTLLESPDILEQIDGTLLQLATEKIPSEASIQAALSKCWEGRDKLIETNRAGAILGNMDSWLRLCEERDSKHLGRKPSEFFNHAYRMNWLIYFLKHSSQADRVLLAHLWNRDQFTSQEADTVYKTWLGYRERVKKTTPPDAAMLPFNTYEDDLLKRFPDLQAPALEGSLKISRFIPIPELLTVKEPDWMVQAVTCDDKLWLCVTTRTGTSFPGAIYGMDISDFKLLERIEIPDSLRTFPTPIRFEKFSACDNAFYYLAGCNIFRYDRIAQIWSQIPLPGSTQIGMAWTSLQTDGKDFYVGSSANSNPERTSGIWKWDSAAKEFQIISSNRRRPAQNRFDDCEGYFDTFLFAGPKGKLGVCVYYKAFLFNAEAGEWDVLKDAEDCSVCPIVTSNHTLLLSKAGCVGLIKHGETRDIEWCQGKTPASCSADDGVLPLAYSYLLKRGRKVSCTLAYCDGKLWHCQPRNETPSRHHLLRCVDWKNPDLSLPAIPLEFEIPEAVQAFLPNSDLQYSASAPPRSTHPLDELQIIATKKGLIFWAYNLPGFWFVPNEQLNAALKSTPSAQQSLPESVP